MNSSLKEFSTKLFTGSLILYDHLRQGKVLKVNLNFKTFARRYAERERSALKYTIGFESEILHQKMRPR